MTKLDYRLRPSKAVQRHMIVEVCRRLAAFAPLRDYQYVGFGGLEFVDFDLMHRALGLEKMISIERNTMALGRYLFNIPFKAIEVYGGPSSDQLVRVDWSSLSIVWLDYECRLQQNVLEDLAILAARLLPGSALFVTLNATPPTRRDGRRDDLVSMVGEARLPTGVTDESLALWGLAGVQRTIVTDALIEELRNRPQAAFWDQIININYADDAKMQTVGGVITAPGMRRSFESCRFEEFEFARIGADPLMIRVPVLTPKERFHLESQVPLQSGVQLDLPGLSDRDKEDFLNVYRYHRNRVLDG